MAKRKIAIASLIDTNTGEKIEDVSLRTESDAVDMPDGSSLTATLEQMKSESGGAGGERLQYVRQFTASEFTRRIQKQILIVSASEHGLGVNVLLRQCLRLSGADYWNILYQYSILANGDVTITSDEGFDGKIILEGY